MKTVTKEFKFCAAHRLMGHDGLCKNIHGHNYVVLVTIESSKLNSQGMVVDFNRVKETVGKWIDANWDHALLYSARDQLIGRIVREMSGMAEAQAEALVQRAYKMPGNPTAETMAKHRLEDVIPDMLMGIDSGLTCICVKVYETPTSSAEASRYDGGT